MLCGISTFRVRGVRCILLALVLPLPTAINFAGMNWLNTEVRAAPLRATCARLQPLERGSGRRRAPWRPGESGGGHVFVAEETTAGRRLSLGDLLVLNELVIERRMTNATATDLMQIDERAARAQLNQMVDRGLLEARGERRGRTYHLTASVYRALGNPAGYVRVHGFEPVQQEQMILQYVDAHRTITRGQAAELCRIHPRQARRVLRDLVGRGELVLLGQRRGSYYERPIIVMDNV